MTKCKHCDGTGEETLTFGELKAGDVFKWSHAPYLGNCVVIIRYRGYPEGKNNPKDMGYIIQSSYSYVPIVLLDQKVVRG